MGFSHIFLYKITKKYENIKFINDFYFFLYIYMYMKTKYTKDKEKRINVLMSDTFRKEYKIFCINKGFIMSERIRQLIEMDLRGEIEKE